MLCEVPLTKEQQDFAAEHHGLVYKFLNDNHLPEDEFYGYFWLLKGCPRLFFKGNVATIFFFDDCLEDNVSQSVELLSKSNTLQA